MVTKVKTQLTKLKGMRKDWKTTGKALKTINPKIKNVDKWAKGSFNYQAREVNTGKFSPAQFTHPRRQQPTPVEQFAAKEMPKLKKQKKCPN